MKGPSSNLNKTHSNANANQPFIQKKSEQEAALFPPPLSFNSDPVQRRKNENLSGELHANTVTPVVQTRRNSEQIDFSDEETDVVTSDTYDLGETGKRPYDVIQDHVEVMSTTLNTMRIEELTAIQQFLTAMVFESFDSTQADPMGAVFKAVGSELWGAAVGELPSVGGIPASSIINIITAVSDEMERAARAQSSYEIGTYISNLMSSTLTVYGTAIGEFQTTERENLEERFSDAEGIYTEGERIVTGEKATLLRGLVSSGRAFVRAKPSPVQYEQALLTKWIRSRSAGGSGMTDYHSNGRIEIRFNTERQDDGSYTYTYQDAKLYTSSNSTNAASMFTRLMSQQNKKVYEMGVPILVKLKTENVVGGRSYFGFTVNSRTSYQRDHWHPPANRAWQAMPWDPIDSVSRVSGGG